jgi:hypothetical protein
MSIFIGLPNLNLTSARIAVYPDHIKFGASETSSSGVSVYMSLRDMGDLGKALTQQSTAGKKIITAVSSSRDRTTDEIADLLTKWVGDRVPDLGEDEAIYKAVDIMNLVVDSLATSIPGAVDESQVS